MAHEISIIDGRAEAAFAMTPAWHGLGTVLNHAMTSAQAIEAAHLNWTVEKQRLTAANGRTTPEHFATVRTDTGDVLGVVGDRYQIVQNRESFDFLDGLLQDGILKYESAGALRGGRQVWLLARMPGFDTIAEGDDSRRYVMFSTSHDGSAGIQAVPTWVRVVCANTLRIATASDLTVRFRHTGNVAQKLEYARKYLSQFDAQFTDFRDSARLLAERKVSADSAREYIDSLFPPVKEPGRSQSIRERKVESVRKAYRQSRQNIPSIKGSWWSLYNAISESIDHGRNGNSRAKGGDAKLRKENRFASVMNGSSADFKAKAFKLAVSMAG